MKTKKLRRVSIDETNKVIPGDVKSFKEVKLQRNILTRGKHRIKIGMLDRYKLRKHPQNCFIITMLFANGTSKTFVIKTEKSTFKVGKKTYNLIYEEAFYDLSLKNYHLIYHSEFCSPINREILADGDEAFFKVKPDSLKDLIGFKYVEALVRGSNINRMQKVLIIGLIVLGVIVAWVLFGGKT